jgi:hypothetical protein
MSEKQLKSAVILVADRTLSAKYKILFEGIFATMQTTQVPQFMMRNFIAPPVATDESGRARTVPLGLRRVESALLEFTSLGPEDVVCTTPEALSRLLGPWVKIVGFSSSDPLGKGMSNTTTTNFWSGELYSSYWTRETLKMLAEAKKKFGFKTVAGGAGSWQWTSQPDKTQQLGVDVVFDGYFESKGPELFTQIIEGQEVEDCIAEKATAAEHIEPICGASMLGIVELSRGCGRGCKFCTMARQKMNHIPADTILADLETNVAAGINSVVSGSEDFFRYGGTGLKPDFEKLTELLVQMKKIKGLSFMQIDHGNVTSILQLTDAQLREIRELLTWTQKSDYLWVNMGAESANGNLVAANCPGKISPFRPEDWPDLVLEAAQRMSKTGFFPVFSLILGLPGETPDDVSATKKLVEKLAACRSVIFPIFYEPVLADEISGGRAFTLRKMRADHLDLYRTCYEINFKGVPNLFWDNQRAGGVSWFKRAAMQALGKVEVFSWRRTFRKVGREIEKATANQVETLEECTTVPRPQ